ncbi:endonuclease domain-containing protein [Microbacterium sp. A93]|uniref:endonuclease domain-containing protein n=1 Tax=Microbacterium sp. A93 TaxID=3450716 RepID=UPI003F43EFF4
MFPPADLLARLDGVARGTLLQAYGCTRNQLAADTNAGKIRRVRPGVFALPTADTKVVAAAAHGGALSCAAALRAHGVWMLPDPDAGIHVWLGGAGRKHPHEGCSCVTHYSPGRAELGLAPVATALIHVYRCLDQETFFAAYESAWNSRLISAVDRARIRQELPDSAAWLLDLARADAQSGLESILRLRLHLLGIQLDCQVEIDGVGRVDFVIGGRLILEADGKENHAGADKRHKDLIRDAAASALGYETLHFDYAMIVHDWPRVVAAILPALARSQA